MDKLWVFVAFVIVLALIGVAAWLVRRFGGSSIGSNANRGRMPRLAVIDAATVDGRRRLVLVRRDNVEHLLMIGGPTDIVVEPNIVRSMPQRDQTPQRSPAGTELPPTARLPDAEWGGGADVRADSFDHREPAMPEPPPRAPRAPYPDEVRRPLSPIADRHAADSMASFSPEPMVRSEPLLRPEPMIRNESPSRPLPRSERNEPSMPRMPRSSDLPPKAPPIPVRPQRPADPPLSSADQNLADMAQRLEAALRRPGAELRLDGGETRAPSISQMDRVGAPSVAPEPPANRPAPPRPEAPPRDAGPSAPPSPAVKEPFENLEDEMANLLGRPKPSS